MVQKTKNPDTKEWLCYYLKRKNKKQKNDTKKPWYERMIVFLSKKEKEKTKEWYCQSNNITSYVSENPNDN